MQAGIWCKARLSYWLFPLKIDSFSPWFRSVVALLRIKAASSSWAPGEATGRHPTGTCLPCAFPAPVDNADGAGSTGETDLTGSVGPAGSPAHTLASGEMSLSWGLLDTLKSSAQQKGTPAALPKLSSSSLSHCSAPSFPPLHPLSQEALSNF